MRRIIVASLFVAAIASAGPSAGFSYLLSHDGNAITSGGDINLQRVLTINKRMKAPYLWARINGKEYLTHDTGVMAEARAAFREVDALHDDYERIHKQMRPLERREETLEDRIDDITDDHSDHGTKIDREELARLQRELETVSRQLRAVEEEEERIDQLEEKLTAVAEKKLRGIIERAIDRGAARRVD